MALDKGKDHLTCPHCTARVEVSDFTRPVSERVREGGEYAPRTYIIIGRDRLLHSCPIPEG